MRAVVQRVRSSRVTVGEREVGAIGHGLLVLLGVEQGDTAADLAYITSKVRDLRIFDDDGDEHGRKRMNRSVADVGGSVLLVSQFTLLADVSRGRRPSFVDAAAPDVAKAMYEEAAAAWRADGLTVATGEFQASMLVALENDGPVTIWLDSRRASGRP